MKKNRVVIKVEGIVQGVGFRPFIYNLAKIHNLTGFILNSEDGVTIEVEGTEDRINKFISHIKTAPPPLAFIEDLKYEFTDFTGNYKEFKIKPSKKSKKHHTFVSPDIAICNECVKELFDKTNRRFHYFGINCINCGPRFTIIKDLPYDRENTSMETFNMCDECKNEYSDPTNRRYHSQPNCCYNCGPHISLYDNKGEKIKLKGDDEIFKYISELLLEGKIIGIKGIGGYHIVCNAEDDNVVDLLRNKKKRKRKPFAIMSKSIETIKKFCYVNKDEEALLKSKEHPIILLKWKNDTIISQNVAPGLRYLGVMLPYTGLHYLLFNYIDKNLIFTSGNISEEPIVYKDNLIFEKLGDIADYFLTYNREIVISTDDSVLMEFKGLPYMIRRSRGYTPKPIQTIETDKKILALGSQQKSTFSIYFENKIIPSQHIGDMDNYDTLQTYKTFLKHFKKLFSFEPQVIAMDMHPDYIVNKYIDEIMGNKCRIVKVQHHFAHLLSCLIDNRIKNPDEKFIGISFDGTGLGDDGNLWGGEFFIFNMKNYIRKAHFKYVPMPGGEISVKEPARMGISYLYDALGDKIYQNGFITNQLDNFELLMEIIKNRINSPLTSSVGRLFDGVSAILNICSKSDYEGEAAVLLENSITYEKHITDYYNYSVIEKDDIYIIDYKKMFLEILSDIEKNKDTETTSIKFHNTIAEIIADICKRLREKDRYKECSIIRGSISKQVSA